MVEGKQSDLANMLVGTRGAFFAWPLLHKHAEDMTRIVRTEVNQLVAAGVFSLFGIREYLEFADKNGKEYLVLDFGTPFIIQDVRLRTDGKSFIAVDIDAKVTSK